MDKLASYKLDRAFTEGVDITLGAAPDAVFRVRLPSQYNRGYTQMLYGAMQFDISADGSVKPQGGLMQARYAQEDAFIQHCLLSLDGEPIPDTFRTDYPAALAELMEKATALASAIEERVSDTVKKLPGTSDGSESGPGKKSSTVSLKAGAA